MFINEYITGHSVYEWSGTRRHLLGFLHTENLVSSHLVGEYKYCCHFLSVSECVLLEVRHGLCGNLLIMAVEICASSYFNLRAIIVCNRCFGLLAKLNCTILLF